MEVREDSENVQSQRPVSGAEVEVSEKGDEAVSTGKEDASGAGGAWRSVRGVSECEEMNPECRTSMEDAHVALDGFGGVEDQGLFCVFDGHGGRGVVDYLASRFHENLLVELNHEPGSRSIEECLTSSYLVTDVESSRKGLSVSGSTAVTCLIRKEEKEKRILYCANIGDSRAVLSRNGKAERLSFDHKASDPSEMKRIEDGGGFVLRKRVLGILSVSRSFGDHAMKKFVIARPYTSRTELTDSDDFLIIACDGLWDTMTDQEAVDLVRNASSKEDTTEKELAPLLVKESLERGSTDNITALVILL